MDAYNDFIKTLNQDGELDNVIRNQKRVIAFLETFADPGVNDEIAMRKARIETAFARKEELRS